MKANTDDFIKMHGAIWQIIACLEAREAAWCDDDEALGRIRDICDDLRGKESFHQWVERVDKEQGKQDARRHPGIPEATIQLYADYGKWKESEDDEKNLKELYANRVGVTVGDTENKTVDNLLSEVREPKEIGKEFFPSMGAPWDGSETTTETTGDGGYNVCEKSPYNEPGHVCRYAHMQDERKGAQIECHHPKFEYTLHPRLIKYLKEKGIPCPRKGGK